MSDHTVGFSHIGPIIIVVLIKSCSVQRHLVNRHFASSPGNSLYRVRRAGGGLQPTPDLYHGSPGKVGTALKMAYRKVEKRRGGGIRSGHVGFDPE